MKLVIEFKFDWSGYYSSCLGVNMYLLKIGECSLVYDLYFLLFFIDSLIV